MYIDKSYLLSVWTSIPAVTLTLLFLIVMTLCALFEIGGLLHSFSMAQIGRQTDIWSMMAAGLRTCRKTISPRNWPVMLFVLVLFPMTGALSLSNTAYKVKIPSFIEIGIEARPLFRTLFTIAYVFMIIVEIGIFFSINIYVLQKKNFVQSCKDSFMLGKGHFLNTIVCMALFSLTVNFLISTTVSILFYASGEILGLLPGLNSTLVLSGENGVIEDALKQIIRSVLIPSVNNAALTALFYQYYEENESLAGITPHMFRTREISPRVKAAVIGCAVLMVSCSVIYIVHNYGFLAANLEKPAVCAHRGDNASAPDNSYEAFELAANEGLPWIELDVQITADGVVVAEHDQTLKRRFDISRPGAEMTYEELMRHKVVSGSFGVYEDVRITTLKDVLLLAKEHNISVQIETKPSKKKAGLEKEVLRVVEKTGMRDKVMIISLSSESIAKMNATKTYSNTYAEFYIIYTAEVTTPTWTLNIPADVSVTYPVEYINLGEASITDVSNFTAGHIYAFMRYDGLFKKTDDSTKTIPFTIGSFSTNEDCRIGGYGVTASNDNGPVSFGYTNYSALQITIKRNDIAAAESGVYKTTVVYSSAFVAD